MWYIVYLNLVQHVDLFYIYMFDIWNGELNVSLLIFNYCSVENFVFIGIEWFQYLAPAEQICYE